MAIDLTGGMEPSKDFFLAERPEDPQFREERVVLGLRPRGPHRAPEGRHRGRLGGVGLRGLQLNLGFPDGRTVIVLGSGEGRSPLDDDGNCRTFAAGGSSFVASSRSAP